jgi:hypothetical protein
MVELVLHPAWNHVRIVAYTLDALAIVKIATFEFSGE